MSRFSSQLNILLTERAARADISLDQFYPSSACHLDAMRFPLPKALTATTKEREVGVNQLRGPKQSRTSLDHPRIVSLLPFLTDIVHELGLHHLLVGVSHECDLVPEAHALNESPLPRVTSSKLHQVHHDAPLEQNICENILDSEDVSALWNSVTTSGTADLVPSLSQHLCSFYQVDMGKIAQLHPTIILTQLDSSPRTLLHPAKDEICHAAQLQIPSVSRVFAVSDSLFSTVDAVFELHEQIAALAGRPGGAKDVVTNANAKLGEIEKRSSAYLSNREVKVAVVQWPTPLYVAGGWVSSLIKNVCGPLASPLSDVGGPSVCIENSKSLFQNTTVIIFALCALNLSQTRRAVAPFVARAIANKFWDRTQTSVAIVDGRRLFAWLGASNVVESAQVVLEIVTGHPLYGHKGKLWEPW